MRDRPATSAFVLVLLCAASIMGCHEQKAQAGTRPMARVLVAHARRVEVPVYKGKGAIRALSRITLGAELGGTIRRLVVDDGQAIRRGQLLPSLDLRSLSAHARLLDVERRAARRDLSRVASLAGAGAAAQATMDGASARLEAADAASDAAKIALAKAVLTSPVDGHVYKRLREVGEWVGPGAPILQIDADTKLLVSLAVGFRDASRISEGAHAAIYPDQGVPVPARVRSVSIAPAADGSIEVEVEPLDAEAPLTAGQAVSVEVADLHTQKVLVVPSDAVFVRAGQAYVVLLHGKNPFQAAVRPVTLGEQDSKGRVILSGLAEGDAVVAEAGEFLTDGQPAEALP